VISQNDVDFLRSVKDDLDQARGALLAPSMARLLETAPILERSAEALARLETAVRDSSAAAPGVAHQLRRELRSLTTSVGQVRTLLSNAAAFHAGIAGLMGSVAESYTPAGEMACAGQVRTISFRG
jgi:hypothetical protein